MKLSSKIGYFVVVVVLMVAAMVVADQVTPPTYTETPPTEQETTTPDKTLSSDKTDKPDSTGVVDTDVEIQRHFDALRNELRRELLNDRSDTINWWLTATAIFLAFLGILVVLGGYIGFQRFENIEADAKKNVEHSKEYAEEAQELVKKINEQKKQAEEATKTIRKIAIQRKTSSEAPNGSEKAKQAEEAAQEIRRNPAASFLDWAIADADSLEREGKIEEATEKWRSIANIAEGIDNDLAAHAWFSVGYLIQEGDEDAEEQ